MGLHPLQSLSIFPSIIKFHQPTEQEAYYPALNLSNSNFSDADFLSTRFPWIVYGAGAGHFLSTIDKNNLPFDCFLAANTTC